MSDLDTPPTEGQWGKVPRAIVRDESLSCGALRCFIVLSSYADGASRIAQASQARLATDLAVGRRSVQRLLDELALQGWITVSRRLRTRGGWGVNAYEVAPFPLVMADALDEAQVARIVPGDTNSDARESSLATGIAMPSTEHAAAHVDAQEQAREGAQPDLLSQTPSLSDPLLAQRSKANVERVEGDDPNRGEEEQSRERQIRERHRQLEDDRQVKAEQNAWKKLVDEKRYTREEAFLVSARGYVVGKSAWSVYDAALSAKQWRRQEELADAS